MAQSFEANIHQHQDSQKTASQMKEGLGLLVGPKVLYDPE